MQLKIIRRIPKRFTANAIPYSSEGHGISKASTRRDDRWQGTWVEAGLPCKSQTKASEIDWRNFAQPENVVQLEAVPDSWPLKKAYLKKSLTSEAQLKEIDFGITRFVWLLLCLVRVRHSPARYSHCLTYAVRRLRDAVKPPRRTPQPSVALHSY